MIIDKNGLLLSICGIANELQCGYAKLLAERAKQLGDETSNNTCCAINIEKENGSVLIESQNDWTVVLFRE